jgi:methyltransferase (TIGR00027 family)
MHAVSLTAQWTAAIRALESEKTGEALFRDDFARVLAQPDGFDLLQRYRGAGVREFVVIRTRFFDDACRRVLAEQPSIRQVVVVAAGMDTRAYRLQWPKGTTIFEIDYADLLAEKASRLARLGAMPNARRIEVALDLAGEWKYPLVDAGFDPRQPTLWLVEGLLFFLTEEQARAVLGACESLSAAGSRLVVDMISNALLCSPFSQLFLATLRRDGVAWRFGTDEPERLLGDLGWMVHELLEPGTVDAGKQYWPYNPLPREITGVARSWLISAGLARSRGDAGANAA